MNKLRTNARISEVDGLSDTIVRLYKADKSASEDAFLKATMPELEKLSADITTAILKDKTVSNLDTADSVRDEAVRNLGALLSGYCVFPVEEKKNAATSLKSIYDKYAKAGITSANYISESSMIESLLEDLSAESAKSQIEKLDGVDALISKIRSAQDGFTKANDEYTKAKGSKGESASSLKKPLVSVINEKLVTYLNTMSLVGNAALAEFSKTVGTEIDRINSTIEKRGK